MKVNKLNDWDYDSYESKDELYNDEEGTFLDAMLSYTIKDLKKKNGRVWELRLTDETLNETYLYFSFGKDQSCWDFGIAWSLMSIKERIKMKHVVKMVAYIDTEETDLVELGKLGLEKIKKEIESGVCVVDVYKNCVSVEMVCVNINESKKNAIEESKKTD